MSSKVILLKYVPRVYDPAAAVTEPRDRLQELGVSPYSSSSRGSSCCDKTAIVVQWVGDGFLSIQGYPPVHHSEKHKAWSIFQVRDMAS